MLIDEDCERWLRDGGASVIPGETLVAGGAHEQAAFLAPQIRKLLSAGAKNVWLAPTASGESLIIELPSDEQSAKSVTEAYIQLSAIYEIENPQRFVGEKYAELSILL